MIEKNVVELHVNNNDTPKVKSSWVLPVALIVINGVYEIEIETNVGEEEIYINKKNGNIIAEKEVELIKNEDDDDQDEDDMDHDDLDD